MGWKAYSEVGNILLRGGNPHNQSKFLFLFGHGIQFIKKG